MGGQSFGRLLFVRYTSGYIKCPEQGCTVSSSIHHRRIRVPLWSLPRHRRSESEPPKAIQAVHPPTSQRRVWQRNRD